jgi:hypothetical protein
MVKVGLWCAVFVAACGGDKNMSGDDDGGMDARAIDGPGGNLIAAHAKVLHGPTSTTMTATGKAHFGPLPAPSDGRWTITPDKAKITLLHVDLVRSDGQPYIAPLTDCTPEYDRTSATLTQLLDCPFDVPAGTYIQVGITASTTYQMLLDDQVNGIYTNGTGVVTTDPGTPSYSTFTVPGPGGIGTELNFTSFLAEPVVVDDTHPLQTEILVDMIHMIGANISGGAVTIDVTAPTLPATIMASASGAGKTEFYSVESPAENMRIGPLGNTGTWGGVRVLYGAPPQPSYIFYPVPGPSQAYNVNPATAPDNGTGSKAGGYLGIDSTNTMCWAMPTDGTYTTYSRVCRMALVAAGDSTTVECQTGSTAPAPTSGDTYASGCPAITPNETANVTLIAQ